MFPILLGFSPWKRKIKMNNVGIAVYNCQYVLDLLSTRLAFSGNKLQSPKRIKLWAEYTTNSVFIERFVVCADTNKAGHTCDTPG